MLRTQYAIVTGWLGSLVVPLVCCGLELGAPLPDFALPGVDGRVHRAADFADAEVLAVVFTCNHCPTAQAYDQRIMKLHEKYRARGVALVAVSPNDERAVRLDELGYSDLNDSLEEMKIRARQRGFAFPYLYDGETQAFSRAMGVAATPQVFVFDRDRTLRYTGRVDDSDIAEVKSPDAANAIEDLLAGRAVRTPKTRTFGCSTKWSEKRESVAADDRKWEARPVDLKPISVEEAKALAANAGEDYLLLNVWATWCGPCITEFPELVRMQRMYQRRPFRLATISINAEERHDQVLKVLRDHHAAVMSNYRFGSTDLDALAEALDSQWPGPVPYTLFIAPGGEVVYRKVGEFDAQELKTVIADRLGRTYASRRPR